VQLRREANAAQKRLGDGQRDHDDGLIARARDRLADIRASAGKLRGAADLERELELDQVLKQIDQLTAAK
jgi:hypothetical protein